MRLYYIILHDSILYVMIWYDMIFHCTICLYDTLLYEMIWYLPDCLLHEIIFYDMIWYCIVWYMWLYIMLYDMTCSIYVYTYIRILYYSVLYYILQYLYLYAYIYIYNIKSISVRGYIISTCVMLCYIMRWYATVQYMLTIWYYVVQYDNSRLYSITQGATKSGQSSKPLSTEGAREQDTLTIIEASQGTVLMSPSRHSHLQNMCVVGPLSTGPCCKENENENTIPPDIVGRSKSCCATAALRGGHAFGDVALSCCTCTVVVAYNPYMYT